MSGKCAACGRAYVPDGPGLLRAALVCGACFGGAVAVVPMVETARCRCGDFAAVCAGCADAKRARAAGDLLGPAIRTLTAIRRQHETTLSISTTREPLTEEQRTFLRGKIEALDGAIAILETESKASEARAVLTMLTTDPPTEGNDAS